MNKTYWLTEYIILVDNKDKDKIIQQIIFSGEYTPTDFRYRQKLNNNEWMKWSQEHPLDNSLDVNNIQTLGFGTLALEMEKENEISYEKVLELLKGESNAY